MQENKTEAGKKKKGFLGKLMEKFDKKLENQAKKSSCCGGESEKDKGSSCC